MVIIFKALSQDVNLEELKYIKVHKFDQCKLLSNTSTPEAILLNKSSCLAWVLDVTKLMTINVMSFVALSCPA